MRKPGRSPLEKSLIGLRSKTVLLALFVFLAAAALGLNLLVDFQARQLLRQADREAGRLAALIGADISETMLRGDPGKVQQILTKAGRNGRISRVWLSDSDGKVVASTIPKDIGRKAEGLTEIRKGRIRDILDRGTGSADGNYIVSRTVNINNDHACAGCHFKDAPVIGRVTVGISYGRTLSELSAVKGWFAAGAAGTGILLAISMVLLLTRSFLPVRVLTAKMEDDLDEKVKKLTTLSEISRSMNGIHKLGDLLRMVLGSAVRELEADRGSVMLYEKELAELFIHTGKGLSPEGRRRNRFRLGEGVAGWVAEKRMPAFIADTSQDGRFLPGDGAGEDISLLCVPLISSADEVLGVINIERAPGSKPFRHADMEYLLAMAGQASVAIENVELIQSIEKSYYDTISALAKAVEAKDPYTLGHSDRVTQLAIAIGEEMGLARDEINTLQYGATLHDLGKIGISESVLNKPGKLSDEEYALMKAHAEIGDNIVMGVDFLQKVRPIIRSHQERYDGAGYPDGLKGEEIPLLVSIVAVADNYDALTSDRPYRRAKSPGEAVRIIVQDSGAKFDPRVVEAFLRIFGDGQEMAWKRSA